MPRNFESENGTAGTAAIAGAWIGLFATPGVGILHDKPYRDWKDKIGDLEAQKAKIKADIHGPMHHLAVVESGLLTQKIKGVQAHEPEQFGGLEGIEIMGGLILFGVVLATTATYGIRRAARFVKNHNPLAT